MMMEASPPAALEMVEPELVLEFLIVALDAPAELREADEGGAGRCSSRWAGRTRSRAKRECIAPRVPSRHVTVRHAVAGSALATCVRLCGVCVAVRSTCVGGRPRPCQRFGGRGA